ncbi:hypothetical protein PARPLA_01006 [Rhodobacteraceae bacterium THAF1]|uniref:hypothetical protein n=1 Tax=Palleronia sp. THAF1 TaxID=2587842 RepID=UPI000F3CB2F2|nr:hypothetical protein [Palleronia sp. THAF1]QFU07202.1 hypothetical protein FIU81_00775 [Palleronia sp. THAF1]VDC20608.1 hypothetical protein PARPLA_01006 [Rhodobacteraceae bacterium THAF1]
MTASTTITSRTKHGTTDYDFYADADAFDALIDLLHRALDAESLIGPNYSDPAVAGLVRDAESAWILCQDSTARFLFRPHLCADHILAAEHLYDILQSESLGEIHGFIIPVTLTRAALRNARRRDVRSVVLARQLNSVSCLLHLIITEARDVEADTCQSDAVDPEVSAA